MLVSMKNSELIDQLVVLAEGDFGLVEEAIKRSAEGADGVADLEKVVDYIVRYRQQVA